MVRNLLSKAEIFVIVLLAIVPLFIHLPYRVNIFLSWEGAYRISEGQLPFRDFGTPLGGMYWVIPAIFFKVFGAKMISLIKAQVFINIISGLAFRSILISLDVNKGIRQAAVLLFCISYSFFNFWPWYNHSVIVYELVALACLFKYTAGGHSKYHIGWLPAAALLTVCSFLTKQDGGGMAFGLSAGLLAVYGLTERKWKALLVYLGSFVLILLVVIGPFLHSGFGYWFNHGQAPHTARVSLMDIAEEFFNGSQWIKFYFFITLVLAVARFRHFKGWQAERNAILLLVLTWGILGEAAVFQVTSYTPPDNNIFFHGFGFVCVFSMLGSMAQLDFGKPGLLAALSVGILLWWSGTWWKYTQRVLAKALPAKVETRTVDGLVKSTTGENVVNRSTYMINRDTVSDVPMEQWVECGLRSFDKINMPAPTVDGIHRLMKMPLVSGSKGELKVLNMSELTPLAAEIPYQLERNSGLPLWYHLGVGMFNRQVDSFSRRIADHHYDLILYEYIPNLNNFYPWPIRDSLRAHYKLVDSFLAPRRGPETKGDIEVYIKP